MPEQGRTSALIVSRSGVPRCLFCAKPATHFRDALSRKEYGISFMCQACQDEVFEEDDVTGDEA